MALTSSNHNGKLIIVSFPLFKEYVVNFKDVWVELLELRKEDFIGGEIEHIEFPRGIYRGPIVSLVIENDKLVVTTEWTARRAMDADGNPTGDWRKVEREGATQFTYELRQGIISEPRDIGETRHIRYTHYPYPFSRVTWIPAGDEKLDPAEVEGL